MQILMECLLHNRYPVSNANKKLYALEFIQLRKKDLKA